MTIQSVLIDGQWRASAATDFFQSENPRTQEALPELYPISPWDEVDQALAAADRAFQTVRGWPGKVFAGFLEAYADAIESRASDLIHLAHLETGLPVQPRLQDAELPRTINQLRQAASAAADGSWAQPTIDTKSNIRAVLGPVGPTAVFGPNNFPFAFNSIAGGDFAAAVAAGNPVIAKGHSSHPATTRVFGEAAQQAAEATGMPSGFVQLLYRIRHEDGERLVSDPRLGACGYTGGRSTGLVLKAAADKVGKPIYLELSSINPVVFLPGAVRQRSGELAEQFAGSCLMGTGQFCTSPGLVLMVAGPETEALIAEIVKRVKSAPVGTLLGRGVATHLRSAVEKLIIAGAECLCGGKPGGGTGYSYQNTVLRASGRQFLDSPEALQLEAFGNASLLVVVRDLDELGMVLSKLEGNLTGTIYSANDDTDSAAYDLIVPVLRQKVGRLLNDRMPTGVAVVPSMNHGGPFPATGHPGFTAVGIPASMRRFGMLQCYDNVRPHRLPASLMDKNPSGALWRLVDGQWTQGDVVPAT